MYNVPIVCEWHSVLSLWSLFVSVNYDGVCNLWCLVLAGDQGIAGSDRQRQGNRDEGHLEGRDVQGRQRAPEGVRQPDQPDPPGLREQNGVPGKPHSPVVQVLRSSLLPCPFVWHVSTCVVPCPFVWHVLTCVVPCPFVWHVSTCVVPCPFVWHVSTCVVPCPFVWHV